jgi:hypothetical protein
MEAGIPTQYPPSPISVPYWGAEFGGGGGSGFGSGRSEIPRARMHPAQWSSRAYACADGGADGGRFTGSKCWQAVCAASNAGEAELIPGTLTLNPPPFGVGSGKFDTPCERMQRAKLSPSCCAWAWLGLEPELAGEPELLGELEPHAAITALARTTATTGRNLGATQDTAQLLLHHQSHHGNRRSDPPTVVFLATTGAIVLPRTAFPASCPLRCRSPVLCWRSRWSH